MHGWKYGKNCHSPMVSFSGHNLQTGNLVRDEKVFSDEAAEMEPEFSPGQKIMPPVSIYEVGDGAPRVYEISVTISRPLDVVLSRCLMRFPQGRKLRSGGNEFVFETGAIGICAQDAVAIIKGIEGVNDAYWLGGSYEPHNFGINEAPGSDLPSID